MGKLCVIFFTVLFQFGTIRAGECENGWAIYKDELCVKSFTGSLVTYNEAELLCRSQVPPATLVMVKTKEMQNFLVNHTKGLQNDIWLGSKYNNDLAQFIWSDGDILKYTNWAEGYPTNTTGSDLCVSLKPSSAIYSDVLEGEWVDVSCNMQQLVVCQRMLGWSLEDAVNELIRLRYELEAVSNELESFKGQVVPVGSIYIEYYNQASPTILWPAMAWEDVTTIYSGLFFRALGTESEDWGKTQVACSPKITQLSSTETDDRLNTVMLPANGWSKYLDVGGHTPGPPHKESMRVYVENCEVRPKNQAIRIWKRID